MKERVTLTIDSSVLSEVDKRVDGHKVKNRSHGIELLLIQALGTGSLKTAFILAGGKGTRLKPITIEIPKPLVPVHDKTLLEHLFDLFKRHGIRTIVLSVGYKAEKIKEVIGNGRRFGMNVTYVEEKEPLGT